MQTWLLVAFIAPFLWALVVLLDVYFTQKAYSEAAEGTIISAFYQGIVLLAIPFVGYSWPSSGWMFFFGGMLFILFTHWYIRSLVIGGDGPIAQIILNLGIVLVPLFAFFLSGEELSIIQYGGIALAFFAGFMLAWDKKIIDHHLGRIVKNILPAVVALSLSMTLQKEGFNQALNFLPGFLTFSLGVVAGGCVTFFLHPRKRDIVGRITQLCRRYGYLFLLGETLSVIAIFSSSYAINLAPSVSFVIVIESLVPVFVMVMSILLARIFLSLKKPEYRRLYEEQMMGVEVKLGATAMMALAIYLIV